MRIDKEIDQEIKKILSEKPFVSKQLEAALFEKADVLLMKRRELHTARQSVRCGILNVLNQVRNDVKIRFLLLLESVTVFPDLPATAVIFTALLLALLSFQESGKNEKRIQFSDLPAFRKSNDFPDRYDSKILTEKNAYEREVKDAHERTSGGL